MTTWHARCLGVFLCRGTRFLTAVAVPSLGRLYAGVLSALTLLSGMQLLGRKEFFF